MKKIGLCKAALVAMCIVFMTSCLGDSNTEMTFVRIPAAVTMNGGQVVAETAVGRVYSSDILRYGIMPDECVLLSFRYDSSLPENENVGTDGSLTVSITEQPIRVNQSTVMMVPTDTATLMLNEQVLAASVVTTNPNYFGYLNNKLFLLSAIQGKSGDEYSWNVFFDSNQEPTTTQYNGNTVNEYKAYMRAVRSKEGTGSAINLQTVNAYNAESLVMMLRSKEAGLKNEVFAVNFHYLSDLNAAKDSLTWSRSDWPVFFGVEEQ